MFNATPVDYFMQKTKLLFFLLLDYEEGCVIPFKYTYQGDVRGYSQTKLLAKV